MTVFMLKFIASVCMLIDHIGAIFATSTPMWFRWIGRIAFPIYAYLIAQGCKQTKSINKYLYRLGLFALISEIPFDLAFNVFGNYSLSSINFMSHTNVFYTLFLGCASIAVYERLKIKKRSWLALLPILLLPLILLINLIDDKIYFENYSLIQNLVRVPFVLYIVGTFCFTRFLPNVDNSGNEKDIKFFDKIKKELIAVVAIIPFIVSAGALKTDYEMFGVALIFIIYLFNPNNRICRSVVVIGGIFYLYGKRIFQRTFSLDDLNGLVQNKGWEINSYYVYATAFALVSVVTIFLYNGKKGKDNKVIQWFFYAFYPLHIAILVVIHFII